MKDADGHQAEAEHSRWFWVSAGRRGTRILENPEEPRPRPRRERARALAAAASFGRPACGRAVASGSPGGGHQNPGFDAKAPEPACPLATDRLSAPIPLPFARLNHPLVPVPRQAGSGLTMA